MSPEVAAQWHTKIAVVLRECAPEQASAFETEFATDADSAIAIWGARAAILERPLTPAEREMLAQFKQKAEHD